MEESSFHDNEASQALARIDAIDEMLAKPFREFLEGYGTEVIINKSTGSVPLYFLVIGDEEFVKKYTQNEFPRAERTALIIYDSTLGRGESLSKQTKNKVALVDPSILSSRLVLEFFAFFFTSKDGVLDLRTNKTDKIVTKIDYADLDFERSDKVRIKESIDSIFAKERTPSEKVLKTPAKKSKHSKPGLLKKLFYISAIAVVIFILPFLWYGVSLIISGSAIYVSAKEISGGRISTGEKINDLATGWIGQSRMALMLMGIPFQLYGMDNTVRSQERLLSFLQDVNGGLRDIGSVIDKGRVVATLLLTTAGNGDNSGTSLSPAVAIDQLEAEILATQAKLNLGVAELSFLLGNRVFPFSLSRINNQGQKIINELTVVRQNITYIDNFLSLYPDLAGFKAKKTYLVLFQNSMELRPTGGFIGSLAKVNFEDGRLADIEIQDVYSLDGQLKGHVDPPLPIREILGEEHWYLRDSNWDPDFAKAGAQAAWFYEKETGNTVDGVIGVSSTFLVDLLKAVGPIELSDYNDRITADNFFGKSLYYSQNNFFPGSTQKKDFLGSLANSLVTKLTAKENSTNPNIFFAGAKALKQGNILFYFSDQDTETVVKRYGWSGSMPRHLDCAPDNQNCISDGLTVIEANLGVNKADYYLNREVENKITFTEDGKIEETTSINYTNKSSADNPSSGSGPYKMYIRFYLPKDSVFEGGAVETVNLVSRNPKNKAQPLPYFEEDDSNPDEKIIGIAMVVPEASSRRLIFTYKRANSLKFGAGGADYQFVYPLQPGLTNTTINTEIIYPIFWTAKEGSGDGKLSFLAKQAKLQYNTSLSEDQKIELTFTK